MGLTGDHTWLCAWSYKTRRSNECTCKSHIGRVQKEDTMAEVKYGNYGFRWYLTDMWWTAYRDNSRYQWELVNAIDYTRVVSGVPSINS
jgi:hypothetical protein